MIFPWCLGQHISKWLFYVCTCWSNRSTHSLFDWWMPAPQKPRLNPNKFLIPAAAYANVFQWSKSILGSAELAEWRQRQNDKSQNRLNEAKVTRAHSQNKYDLKQYRPITVFVLKPSELNFSIIFVWHQFQLHAKKSMGAAIGQLILDSLAAALTETLQFSSL